VPPRISVCASNDGRGAGDVDETLAMVTTKSLDVDELGPFGSATRDS